MTLTIYLAIYAGILIFLVGCVRRILQYARTPVHLRWELYPVPHEEPERVDHGGSYFESGSWRLSPQTIHHRREATAMLQEIVLLKGLREYNPNLWWPSFAFHFGLYLSIATLALLAAAVIPSVLAPDAGLAQMMLITRPICRWMGCAAAALVIAGAAVLLVARMTSRELRNYTKAGDIFNLAFFIVTFALLLAGLVIPAPDSASRFEVLRGLLRFNRHVVVGSTFGAGLILGSALAAYIPFTHMSHFIAKYFTYHAVRWDDRRNERGSAIEGKVAEYLTYRPTWAATHVGADGKRSWAEIATTNPAQEVRK